MQTIQLWDDNPTVTDLLGIDSVVDATITAITSSALDPVTVSIQSPWGGGKSSALNMIESRLCDKDKVVVLRADPWEYEDVDDIRGTLISEVLGGLQKDLPPALLDRVGGLLKRISWTRVAKTVTKSAITMSMDPAQLVDAFTLKPEEPKTMSGFRQDFAKLMEESGLERVVVLVDDLDRCKPQTVMSTLEAIKVFLSVPKMAFVLAAEEEMIRWAIAQDTHGGGRSDFADRYLEKIVQLPVTLPRLTAETAETYVTLLLCEKRSGNDADSFKNLLQHVAKRRAERKSPYLGGTYQPGVLQPHSDDIALAALIARGLDADKWNSPRAIKRFLNSWALRESVAATRGLSIAPDVSLKLFILEQRFLPDFKRLVETNDAERPDLLERWEAWGKDPKNNEKPDSVSEATAAWAASDPSLAKRINELDTYIHLAQSFTSLSAGSGLSDQDLQTLAALAHASDTERKAAIQTVTTADENVRAAIFDKLMVRLPTFENRSAAIASACAIATADTTLEGRFAEGLKAYGWAKLEMADAMEIANAFPSKDGVTGEFLNAEGVDGFILDAINDHLTTFGD